MIVRLRPFTRAERIAAWIFAAICWGSGALGVVLGVARSQYRLAVLGCAVIALGAAYARSGWSGRPLRWPRR